MKNVNFSDSENSDDNYREFQDFDSNASDGLSARAFMEKDMQQDFKSSMSQTFISAAADEEEKDKSDDIDFDEQMKKYKKLTEMELPYTSTQVEDAMYLNHNLIVTLEYTNYQNTSKYHNLNETYLEDKNNSLCTHLFNDRQNMSQWKKDDIIHYELEKKDFVKEMIDNPETCTFNKVTKDTV